MLCNLAKLAQYSTKQPLNIESKHWTYLPSLAVIAADLHASERKCPFPLLANCFLNSGLKQRTMQLSKEAMILRSCYIHLTLQVHSHFIFKIFSLKIQFHKPNYILVLFKWIPISFPSIYQCIYYTQRKPST